MSDWRQPMAGLFAGHLLLLTSDRDLVGANANRSLMRRTIGVVVLIVALLNFRLIVMTFAGA